MAYWQTLQKYKRLVKPKRPADGGRKSSSNIVPNLSAGEPARRKQRQGSKNHKQIANPPAECPRSPPRKEIDHDVEVIDLDEEVIQDGTEPSQALRSVQEQLKADEQSGPESLRTEINADDVIKETLLRTHAEPDKQSELESLRTEIEADGVLKETLLRTITDLVKQLEKKEEQLDQRDRDNAVLQQRCRQVTAEANQSRSDLEWTTTYYTKGTKQVTNALAELECHISRERLRHSAKRVKSTQPTLTPLLPGLSSSLKRRPTLTMQIETCRSLGISEQFVRDVRKATLADRLKKSQQAPAKQDEVQILEVRPKAEMQ